MHWACEKIKKLAGNKRTDDDICNIVHQKISMHMQNLYNTGGGISTGQNQLKISYLDIAEAAFHIDRKSLAIKLLEFENNPSEHVPLLLSMQVS